MAICNQSLTGYTKVCADKQVVGGVTTDVYITLRENIDFENITLDTDNNVITNIPMLNNTTWYKYQFDKNTASLESTYNYDSTTGEKSFCTNNLTLIFRRMDAAKRLAITSLLNSEVVVAVKDCNGTCYFLGYEEYVASTSATATTGTAKTDSNAATIILTDSTADLPLQISSTAWSAIETNIPA